MTNYKEILRLHSLESTTPALRKAAAVRAAQS